MKNSGERLYTGRSPLPAIDLLPPDADWRKSPSPAAQQPVKDAISVRRYVDPERIVREKCAPGVDQHYVLALSLIPSTFSAFLDGKEVCKGPSLAGTVRLNPPGSSLKVIFQSPIAVIHLFIPRLLLSSTYDEFDSAQSGLDIALKTLPAGNDPTLQMFIEALARTDDVRGPGSGLYAESIGLTILTRLLIHYSNKSLTSPYYGSTDRANTRIRRVQEYIDETLTKPISLVDLAKVAGLSRMHFAAEFKRVTGVGPHNYLTQRKVDRAKHFLLASTLSIQEIASLTGFETDSHFCVVFKRLTGESPACWRASR